MFAKHYKTYLHKSITTFKIQIIIYFKSVHAELRLDMHILYPYPVDIYLYPYIITQCLKIDK